MISNLILLAALLQKPDFPVITEGPPMEFLMVCESASTGKLDWYRVKNCKIADGHTLDEVINEMGRERNSDALCGAWGPWIHDHQGNIMGSYRNPPCPKKAPQ